MSDWWDAWASGRAAFWTAEEYRKCVTVIIKYKIKGVELSVWLVGRLGRGRVGKVAVQLSS